MSPTIKPIDPRMKRTLSVIKDALLSLIDEKGFDQTSVRDITGRAQINRATFYLHYQDKYDLLEKLVDERLQEFREAVQLPPSFGGADLNLDADAPPLPLSGSLR
ncbi:TetR/AcrR family transcriptional regulator [Paenibacillus sp. CC-CFT747]|nr:TetR/AcrR family transcriptional regulator [Paenibacillus sp. CC-CFT747]